jgi:fimbrial chaperone protein
MFTLIRHFLLLLVLGVGSTAQGGQFSVNPVRVELSQDNPIAVLKITNQGKEQLTLQTRTLTWDQNDAGDVFGPTSEVLATPPLFTLAPGAEQIVRVGMRRSFDPRLELTYRLFFEEVLPPPSPDFRGIRMALNVSLPVFAGQPDKFKSHVAWRLEKTVDGMALHAINGGSAHLQARMLKLSSTAGGRPLLNVEGNFYILPMKERIWPIKAQASSNAGAYRLEAETDAGRLNIELTPEAQPER